MRRADSLLRKPMTFYRKMSQSRRRGARSVVILFQLLWYLSGVLAAASWHLHLCRNLSYRGHGTYTLALCCIVLKKNIVLACDRKMSPVSSGCLLKQLEFAFWLHFWSINVLWVAPPSLVSIVQTWPMPVCINHFKYLRNANRHSGHLQKYIYIAYQVSRVDIGFHNISCYPCIPLQDVIACSCPPSLAPSSLW